MSQNNLIGLRCENCGRAGYITHTNPKKMVQRKIELRKYCKWCRKQTLHKEAKLPLKAAPKKKAPVAKKSPVVAEKKVIGAKTTKTKETKK